MGKYAIVTGISRGLGFAVAKLFLESGVGVIGISRKKNKELESIAKEYNQKYKHYTCDLADIDAVETLFQALESDIKNVDTTALYLVNNAAVVEPINQAVDISTTNLIQHFHINVVAPMVLTKCFLNFAIAHDVPLTAVMVTSGAAERPISGWSAYCSSKASINMYTKTVALEQEEANTKNKIIAFNPGVMDTAMQETIRSSSEEAFTDVKIFQAYKEKNILKDPLLIAGILVDILNDEGVVNGKSYNVKDYV